MSGRRRLPGGEPRRAGQRRSRRTVSSQLEGSRIWRVGDPVRWRDRVGVFSRDLGGGEHAEIKIADRIYRVRIADLS